MGDHHSEISGECQRLSPQQILEEIKLSSMQAQQLLAQRDGYLGEFWRLVDRYVFADPASQGYVPMPVLQKIFAKDNGAQPWLELKIFELEKDGKLEVKRLGKEGPIRAVRVIDL